MTRLPPTDASGFPASGAPSTIAATPDLAPHLVLTARLSAILVLLGLLWGGAFFLTQIILKEIGPLQLVALRVGLAALALLAWLAVSRTSLAPLRERAGAFLVLGVLNNAIPFMLLAVGQTEIGGGLASILNATTPLWTILIAAAFTGDEKLSGNKLAGVALGIAGVAVLVGPEALGAGKIAPLWAFAAILGATVSYAFAAVFAKRFRGVAPVVVATGQLAASSLVMVPIAAFFGGGFALGGVTTGGAAAMLTLALLSTAFPFILYFEVIAKSGATNASLVTFLVPASAILLGILFLGEALTLREILGFALVLAGLVAVDGRLLRRLRKAHPTR